ncbi:MAG: endopeptidase La [Elusimicrobiota bacterium]
MPQQEAAKQLRPESLPLLAVRDIVIFPHMALPLSVGRERSIKALEQAMKQGKLVAVTSQKKAATEDPNDSEFYKLGVLAEVVQFLRMPDGTLKIFLQGLARAKFKSVRLNASGWWQADIIYPAEKREDSKKAEASSRQVLELYEKYLKLTRRQPPESIASLSQLNDPSRLADSVASICVNKIADRQELLETLDPIKRLEKLTELMSAELEILAIERRIHSRVRGQIQKTQKEYYLTEQMRAIQKELRQKDDFGKELDELRDKIKSAKMPKTAEETSIKEVARLEKMMPYSPEATVCRSYLEWMIALPWSKKTRDMLDIPRAHKILEEDHYGLKKAKERILEYLAVCKLTKKLRGPILCFVGPPGVGKTSLGRSIAHAMNREFVRISLGGVRDEAEIRGHRRTYIGSLPGRIIQSLRRAKSRNPVFLLDEIDKMGSDWRGDPTSALLEALDPEQNSAFMDHYLDVEFDLSSVLFVCTANVLSEIPPTLRDRLEIIRFSGYTYDDKARIARGYLIPKQVKMNGLKPSQITFSDDCLDRIIEEYTSEAGVRTLERRIAGVCRKAALEIVEKSKKLVSVCADNLQAFLGIPKYKPDAKTHNEIGVATGLAWTEVGGVLLAIEVLTYAGKGGILLTGKLGDVMQESAKAALSYIKAHAEELAVPDALFKKISFHVHVPEGATPKDGPSAGIAIATALASQVTRRPVLPGIAMTGEITLRGRVLPIGGLKEKIMAAYRSGVKTVLYPEQNLKDLEDVPEEIVAALKLVPVKHISEVLAFALAPADEKSRAGVSWKPPLPELAGDDAEHGYPTPPQA